MNASCASCRVGLACGLAEGRPCAFIARRRHAGEQLYLQDAPATSVFYVKEGTVALLRVGGEGEGERPVGIRGPGSFLGLEVLVRDRYLDTARVLTDVAVCAQPAGALDAWLGPRTSPARVALEQTLRGLVTDTPRAAGADGNAPRRVARWILDNAQASGATALPRALVASMLGMVPATFSRALARLAGAGAIYSTRRAIEIRDRAALERQAAHPSDHHGAP